MECRHQWSEWDYNHNGGSEFECFERMCRRCNEVQKVLVDFPRDAEVLEKIADTVAPWLSGQYGIYEAKEIAIEILQAIRQAHRDLD